MKSEELDELLYNATNYDWKENNDYFAGPNINGKGMKVTKFIVNARKRLVAFIKEKDPNI